SRRSERSSRWLPDDCAPPRRAIFLRPTPPRRVAEIDVADRPQDQPKPVRSGLSAPVRSAETGAREVVAYLREHPDFLERHPDALRLLRAPGPLTRDGVRAFQHFMLERLRSELPRLQAEHMGLIATSRGNLASQ